MSSKIANLASDTFVYGFFTILGRFLTFMLIPLYSNYLSIDGMADISYIFSLIAFVNVVISFGMEAAFFRFFSKDDLHQSKKVFTLAYCSFASIGLIFTIVVLIFSDPIASSMLQSPDSQLIIIFTALIPLFDGLMVVPYGYLRMVRDARRFAITRFTLVILAVGFNLLFIVYFSMGSNGVMLAQLVTSVIGAAIFIKLVSKNLIFEFDFKLFKDMLRFGIPTVPANLSAIILQVVDRPVLKLLADSKQMALYQVNHKLGIPMMLIVTVFEYAWKPFYLSNFKEAGAKKLYSRVLTYFTLMSVGVFLFTGFFIEYIVQLPFIGGRFIKPVYWEGMTIIPLILGGYYFNGVYTNFAAGFQITKQTKYLPYPVGIAAVLNVVLNFALIPYFGYVGAAWSMFMSYFVSAFTLYLFLEKVYPMKYEWKRLAILIGVALVVYFAGMYLTKGIDSILSISIRLAAIGVYFIILYFMNFFTKEEMNSMKSLFSRRRKTN